MSNVEKDIVLGVLSCASNKYKGIMISIHQFVYLLGSNGGFDISFQPITDRKILETGWYGNVGSCRICVSKYVEPGTIRYADVDEPTSDNKNDWSPEISYEQWAKDNAGLMTLA